MSWIRSGGSASLVLRAGLRRRAASFVALALATSLAFGFVLAVAAGTRRTSTSFDRFRAATMAPHVMVQLASGDALENAERLHEAPGVESAGGFLYLPVAPDRPGVVPGENAGGFGALHASYGVDVYRYRVLEGRRANPAAEDEITVNRELADLGGLSVGDRVDLASVDDVVTAKATVVGIHVGEWDLSANATNPSALYTAAFTRRWLPAFLEAFGGQISPAYTVRLDDPSPEGQAAFNAWARETFGPEAMVVDSAGLSEQTDDAVGVQTMGLLALLLVAGVAAAFALAQAGERTVTTAAVDVAVLDALGMTRRERAVALAAPVVGVFAVAGACAIVVATAASSLMPTGFARRIEPSPGMRPDLLVTVPLAVVLVAIVSVRAAAAAWSRAALRGESPATARSRRLPSMPSVAATIGVRRALGGAGAASPGQAASTLLALLAAIAGVVAVVTFMASEHHLLTTPRAQGWSFDTVAFAADGDPSARQDLLAQADASSAVEAYGSVFRSGALVGDVGVDAFAFVSVRGSVHPTILDGHVPMSGDQIVLGSPLARSLHTSIGDRVEVTTAAGTRTLTVSGIAAFPPIGDGDFGYAMSVTEAGGDALGIAWDHQGVGVRLRPGTPVGAMRFEGDALGEQVDPYLPPSLLNLERAGDVPAALAAFLAVLGTAAVAHALVLTVRRSRRDVAVLQCLGFVRRQVTAAVAWQATAYAALAIVIGLPVGIVAGRTAWFAVADRLGVQQEASIPVVTIVVVVVAAVVITNAAASVPAWLASRWRPAQVFRTE